MGAARFLRGLVAVVPPTDVTVIGNTGDDIDIYDVRVCPDLDIVTYMLAGALDEERQFGVRGDTHHTMEARRAAGEDIWFALGDRDLAVCAERTEWLASGVPLHECTARIASRHGVEITLVPMTDDRVWTCVTVDRGGTPTDLHFQDYWVRTRAAEPVLDVRLIGAAEARPAPGVLDAIAGADAVVLAPSNPVVSIGTILAVPGIRETLRATGAPVVGVSPIIGGRVVRGMADKLLPVAGAEVSARGVAGLYRDVLNGFVIDREDAPSLGDIEGLGMRAIATGTMMTDVDAAAALAKDVMAFAEELS